MKVLYTLLIGCAVLLFLGGIGYALYYFYFRHSIQKQTFISIPDGLWNTPGKFNGLPKVSGYFAEWSIYGRKYYLADLRNNIKDLNNVIYSFANIYEVDKKMLQDLMNEHDQTSESYKLYQRIHDTLQNPNDKTYISFVKNEPNTEQNYYQGGDQWAYLQCDFEAMPGASTFGYCSQTKDCGNWEIQTRGNLRELKMLKEQSVDISISIGGWTQSVFFSKMTSSAIHRKNFIDTFVNYFLKGNVQKQFGGDGRGKNIFSSVSVDWEFPGWKGNLGSNSSYGGNFYSQDDGNNLGLFLKEIKQAGQAVDRTFQTQVAIIANPKKTGLDLTAYEGNTSFDINSTKLPTNWHQYADEIHIMAYDYMGSFDPNNPNPKGPQANLFPSNKQEGIQKLEELSGDEDLSTAKTLWYLVDIVGVDKRKIHIGIPFYGRGWDANGLPVTGQYTDIKNNVIENGLNTYDFITTIIKNSGSKVQYNSKKDQAYVIIQKPTTYSYTNSEGNVVNIPVKAGDFYSFDDEATIQTKVEFIKQYGYGGIFAWSFDNNKDGTLLKAMQGIKY